MPDPDTQHLLPPLAGETIEAAARGTWTGVSDHGFLEKLANSLAIARDVERRRPIVSVPDVWAQTEQFEHALLIQQSPSAIAEWRGLFAIWALATLQKFRISFVSMSLDQLCQQTVRAVATSTVQSFPHVASELLPEGCLFESQHWAEIGIMCYDDKPIALLTPATILAPARNYSSGLDRRVAWFDGKRLTDPARSTHISDDQLATLQHVIRWFTDRLVGLAKEEASEPSRLNRIKGMLGAYESDVSNALGGRQPFGGKTIRVQSSNYDVPSHKVFTLFNTIHEPPTRLHFEACLRPRPAFRDQVEGAILVDRNLSNVIGKRPNEIFVWHIYSLHDVEAHSNVLNQIRAAAADQGYLTLRPEDFFTDTICKIGDGHEIETHTGEANRFVLPLTPVVLLFMEPLEIARNTRIRERGGKVFVSLDVQVENSDGTVRQTTLERVYDDVADKRQPMALHVWPNFRADWWSYYFVLTSASQSFHAVPRCPTVVGVMRDVLAREVGRTARVEAASEIGSRILNAIGPQRLTDDEDSPLLFLLKSPPEAVLCDVEVKERHPQILDARARSIKRPAGLILMPLLDDPPKSRMDWEVGIDFGTTNTTVYYRAGFDQAPQPLTFLSRSRSPFQAPHDRAVTEAIHAEFFVPYTEVAVPFQTVWAERPLFSGGDRRPLWSERIHFNINLAQSLQLFLKSRKELGFNLKWDERPEERTKVLLFLSQVALQAMAEAAGRDGVRPEQVRWAYAYPEAFGRDDVDQYKRLCRGAVALALSSDMNSHHHPENEPVTETESLCSALYFFSKQHGFFERSLLTLDVGGGTTDVSLWQNNNLVWKGSLKFAGQDILISYLATSDLLPRLLENEPDVGTEVRTVFEQTERDRKSRVNAIELVINSLEYRNVLEINQALMAEQPSMRNLRMIAEFSLTGILYYLALMTRNLGNWNLYDLARDHMRICFAGRGSKLFQDFLSEGDRQRIASMFQSVSGHDKKVRSIVFSEEPKEEVAHGLLFRDKRHDLTIPEALPEPIIGEVLLADGEERPPDSVYTDLATQRSWRCEQLPTLRHMIDLYERTMERRVPFDKTMELDVADRVAAQLSPIQTRANEDSRNKARLGRLPQGAVTGQPLFILALKETVRQFIEKDRAIERLT